jgi:hypothetical protein
MELTRAIPRTNAPGADMLACGSVEIRKATHTELTERPSAGLWKVSRNFLTGPENVAHFSADYLKNNPDTTALDPAFEVIRSMT